MGIERALMGTELLSLFLGRRRLFRPFSAFSGDGTWLDGVGLRWVALWIQFPSYGTTGPRSIC